MKQAFLGAEINKGYIDITISNSENIIKKLVYFDIKQSYGELVLEIDKLFNSGVEVLHCGFISTIISENHWVYKISDLKHNIKFHKVSPVNVLKELKKITDKNLTPTLICNYLKNHSDDEDNVYHEDVEEKVKKVEVLEEIKPKTVIINTVNKKAEIKTFRETLKEEKSKLIVKENNKKEINYISEYNSLILETKNNLINQLKGILRRTLPEAVSFINENSEDWIFKILKKYPSQELISKARLKNITRVSPENKQETINFVSAVKLGVAQAKNSKLEYLIKNICDNILEQKTKNKKIETYVKRTFNHQYLAKLKQLKNLDKFLAIFLVEEIGDINRFETVYDMTTSLGVHYNENEDKKYENRVVFSNYKVILNRLIEKLIKQNPYFTQLYKQKIAQKYSKEKTLLFLEYKLTRIIYSLLKDKKANRTIDLTKISHSNEESLHKKEEVQLKEDFAKIV